MRGAFGFDGEALVEEHDVVVRGNDEAEGGTLRMEPLTRTGVFVIEHHFDGLAGARRREGRRLPPIRPRARDLPAKVNEGRFRPFSARTARTTLRKSGGQETSYSGTRFAPVIE